MTNGSDVGVLLFFCLCTARPDSVVGGALLSIVLLLTVIFATRARRRYFFARCSARSKLSRGAIVDVLRSRGSGL